MMSYDCVCAFSSGLFCFVQLRLLCLWVCHVKLFHAGVDEGHKPQHSRIAHMYFVERVVIVHPYAYGAGALTTLYRLVCQRLYKCTSPPGPGKSLNSSGAAQTC